MLGPPPVRICRDELDATADRHLGRPIAPDEVAEIRLGRWPAEAVLKDGRIVFVAGCVRPALALFARLHGIADRRKGPQPLRIRRRRLRRARRLGRPRDRSY